MPPAQMRIAHQQAVQAKLALTANRTGGNEGGEGAGGCEKVNQTAVAVQVMNYGGDHTNEQMSAATLNLSNLGLHFSNVDHRLQNCGNGGDLGSVSYGVTLLPIPLNLTSTESEGTAASDVTLLGKEANLRETVPGDAATPRASFAALDPVQNAKVISEEIKEFARARARNSEGLRTRQHLGREGVGLLGREDSLLTL